MSKDIWHTKDEIPRQESRVVWKSGNVVCGGRFDTYYKCFCGPASQFVDLKTVSRWAYIDDLLALETENKDLSDKIGKLEAELDRTRKALEIAKDALNEYEDRDSYDCNGDWCGCEHSTAHEALEQITALTKGGDNE